MPLHSAWDIVLALLLLVAAPGAGYLWLDRGPHYRLRNRRFVRRAQALHDQEHRP